VDLGLKGKVAIVAASSKGLGRAVALELAKEGARIAMCSRNRDQVRAAAESIHAETGAEVHYEQCDVTRPEEVRRFVGSTVGRFGNIHILVTNAGGPPSGLFTGLRPQDWSAATSTFWSRTPVDRPQDCLPACVRRTGRPHFN
jgi:3-oxoacyl-[acyl-carrier protein] reductase